MSERYYDNSLILHSVYGQDSQTSKEALRGLLETFLDLKIERVEVKNPNDGLEALQEKNMRLYMVATLEDYTNALIIVFVDSPKEYVECMCENELEKLIRDECINRCCQLWFLDENRHDSERMIQTIRFADMESGKVVKAFEKNFIITVEHRKLKEKSFEEMDAKERYMYYLKHIGKEKNDLLDKILESDKNVQALHKRLKEMGECLDKIHY